MSNEAILLQILAACERTAAATERMADFADERRQAKKAAPPAETKARAPKGDVLTVTGYVMECNLITKRDGEPVLTKKKQEMRKLKLSGGFETTIFGNSSYLPIISKADLLGRPLIIGYTENVDGAKTYQNICSMELGSGGGRPPVEEEDLGTPF